MLGWRYLTDEAQFERPGSKVGEEIQGSQMSGACTNCNIQDVTTFSPELYSYKLRSEKKIPNAPKCKDL